MDSRDDNRDTGILAEFLPSSHLNCPTQESMWISFLLMGQSCRVTSSMLKADVSLWDKHTWLLLTLLPATDSPQKKITEVLPAPNRKACWRKEPQDQLRVVLCLSHISTTESPKHSFHFVN